MVSRTAKSTIFQSLFFFVDYYKVWVLASIRRSVCMSNSHRSLCVSISGTDAGLCIYAMVVFQWHKNKKIFSDFSIFTKSSRQRNNAECGMVVSCPLISSSLIPFPSLLGPFCVHQLQLLSPSASWSIYFSALEQGQIIFHFFYFHLFFILWSAGTAISTGRKKMSVWLNNTGFSLLARFWESICISKSQRS